MGVRMTLLAATILTAACDKPTNQTGPQAADFVIAIDKSETSPMSNNERFAGIMGRTMHDALLAEKPMLGDRLVLLGMGERSADSIIAQKIPISRQYPQAVVARYVEKTLAELPNSPDNRQAESSILFTLTHGDFKCRPGRGRIWVLSDMLNNDIDFSDIRGLLAGTAQFPKPNGRPLKDCRVSVIGIGLTANGTVQLSSAQIANLTAATRRWFIAAGVAPADIDISTGI